TPAISSLTLHDALPIYDSLADEHGPAPLGVELARAARGIGLGELLVGPEETLRRIADRSEESVAIKRFDGALLGCCGFDRGASRSEEHTSELQSRENLV